MEKVKEYILENKLIQKGDVIGVGVSGGSDSMALLNMLVSLQDELDFEVVAIHINHGIREESRDEAEFVMQKCKLLGVRAYKFKIDSPKLAKEKGQSLETAAREGRYEIFRSLIKRDVVDKIALAHHQSDQAETILMHIFRGAGAAGAKGMEPIREKIFIRPILNLTKKEVMDYIMEHNIDFVNDSSNQDNEYSRNFLRNIILPEVEKRWPAAESNIIAFSKTLTEDDAFINEYVNDDAVIYEENIAKIPTSYFLYPTPIVNRLVIKVFKKIGVVKDYEKKHIEFLKELALKAETGTRVALPFEITAIKEYDYITLYNDYREKIEFSAPMKSGEISAPKFGKLIIRKARSLKKRENTLYIDLNKVPKTALWRFREEGDTFTKFGGGSKKLKSFLIDKKIPQRVRDYLPVLANGKEILVIAGVEISEKVKVEENSNIYSIEVKK